jgi:ribosomal protein S21
MSLEVSIREGETQDPLLRRFQRMAQRDGILCEPKAHRYFLYNGEVARPMAAGEIAGSLEEDREILNSLSFCLTHNIYSLIRGYWQSIMDNAVAEERGQHEYLCR